jgi:hypothetical protein
LAPDVATAVAVRADGQIFVRTVAAGSGPAKLIKIDRGSLHQTTVASGGFLAQSTGLAFENATSVVSSETAFGAGGNVVRVDTATGRQTQLAAVDETGDTDIGVAAVNQIPPIPVPVAQQDSYSMPTSDGELHVLAADGVLANDHDPLHQAVTARVVGSTQLGHGFISFFDTGEFFYFPDPGFVGTDTFQYQAVAGSRVSATATVVLHVLVPSPTALDESFQTDDATLLHIDAPGVLVNDSDFFGLSLRAQLLTKPTRGFIFLDSNGALDYLPEPGFVGTVSLVYRAVATTG